MSEKQDCIIATVGNRVSSPYDERLILARLARCGLKVDIISWDTFYNWGDATTVLALQPPLLVQYDAYFQWLAVRERKLLPFPLLQWLSFHLNVLSLAEQSGLPILPTYVFNSTMQLRGLTHQLASARWQKVTATLNQRHAGSPLLITVEHIQRGEAQLNLLLQQGMVLVQPVVETERKKHVFLNETWSHTFVQEPAFSDDGTKTLYPSYLGEGELLFATMAMRRMSRALRSKFHLRDPFLLLEVVTGYYENQLSILDVSMGQLPLHLEGANLDLLTDALCHRIQSEVNSQEKDRNLK